MPHAERYPHAIDCYVIVKRDGLPPLPKNEPVATAVVYSEQEVEETKKRLLTKHPGACCVERPLDWE
jgi:hypothetical protein